VALLGPDLDLLRVARLHLEQHAITEILKIELINSLQFMSIWLWQFPSHLARL
jgi:hypothetical protein